MARSQPGNVLDVFQLSDWDYPVILKTLLVIVLAALAAVATEALSQVPGSATSSSPTSGKSPSAAEKEKSAPAPGSASVKSDPAKTKEAAPSKTFPTSSAYATSTPGSGSGRKQYVVDRALVTLIDDNKVPATEAGMITKLPVKEGSSVDKDEQVAEIDTRSTLAKQQIAEKEHAAATAQAENDAEVEVAEKAVEVSKAEWDQHKEIVEKNPRAVPKTEMRKLEFTYYKSLAQVKQAKSEKNIAGLTASAKKAQYDAASIELDLRQIRSPFKGQVVERMKNVGDWVTPGEPIMHIVGLDRLRVRGYVFVSEADSASHYEVIGKPVTITVDAPGGKKHTVKGIIGFASPVIEGFGSDRQFRIWAEVDNEKATDPVTGQETWKIQPGSMATMTIDLTAKPMAPAKTSFKPVAGEVEKSGAKKKSGRDY
jgi:multidrug efflux pump subunit AcrA (membrane-fusion protein)